MVQCKVVPAKKPDPCPSSSPPPPPPPEPKGCKASHILTVLFLLFLAGVAAASVVVGAIPLYRCQFIFLLDVWLIVHGVSALGAMVGLLVWSSKMATGKFINGPKVFALLLISLNFIWLILGNILVIAAYVTCGTSTVFGTISCFSGFMHFSLVVVIIFDIAYIAFFVLLGIACCSDDGVQGWTHPALGETGCCARPSCLSTLYCLQESPSWQEWVLIIALICYSLLAVTAIALGSSFLNICPVDLWIPYWLIVHGVVTLVTFFAALCCLGFPRWVDISWARTNFVAFLPVLILALFVLFWLTYGNVRAAEFRVNNCPAADVCNSGLHIFTFILIFLLDLPFLVVIYIGIILFVLMTILIIFTCCYSCCHKVDQDTAPAKDTTNESSSSESSDSE